MAVSQGFKEGDFSGEVGGVSGVLGDVKDFNGHRNLIIKETFIHLYI